MKHGNGRIETAIEGFRNATTTTKCNNNQSTLLILRQFFFYPQTMLSILLQ